jgi:hypothetical protein
MSQKMDSVEQYCCMILSVCFVVFVIIETIIFW